jgi:hypothetical protein
MNLERWLSTKETDPDIKHAIVSYLKTWKNGQPRAIPNPFPLQDTLHQQSVIGWWRFFEGWLVREWTNAQQAYYKIAESLRSGRRWTIELIKKLWNMAWGLWEHRNSILHKARNVVSDMASRLLNRQVSLAYNDLQSLLLPAHDRHLLSLKLHRLLKKDSMYKEVWLRNAQAILGSGQRQNQSNQNLTHGMMRGMRRRMKIFLQLRHATGNP